MMWLILSNRKQGNHAGESQIPTLGGPTDVLGSGKCLGGPPVSSQAPLHPSPTQLPLHVFSKTWSVFSQVKGIFLPHPALTQDKRRGQAPLHF